jgi:hypothetical protein
MHRLMLDMRLASTQATKKYLFMSPMMEIIY